MKKWEVPLPTAVDLWAVDLDGERPSLYEPLLAPDERERAGRFHFERDRHRYIVGRGRLRQLIGQYLALPPAQVVFAYTDHGKPYLPPQPDQPDLRFNVTHSQQFALLAFAWGRRLGVDIEVIRPLTDGPDLVRRFFAPAEVAAWEAVPPERQTEAFFCGWTRKEAFIKAIGDGLSYPLDQFVVSLHPDQPAQLLEIEGDALAAQKWEMVSLRPFPQTVAAVVVEKARH
jgi:4'-phosphopantetheinyl transferase